MKNLRLAFWDWNGTLWNDVDQWFIAAKAAYAHANIANDITLSRLQDAFDVPVRDVIYTLGAPYDLPQESHDKLLRTFTDTLKQNDHLSSTRSGASEVLEFFTKNNIESYIASNHPLELLQKELDKSDLSQYFDTICGNDNHDTVYTKGTKQERIQKHLANTGTDPKNACIIADTREEIRIAKEFGMISIAITGGYNSEKVLKEQNPDFIIHDLKDIPRLFIR